MKRKVAITSRINYHTVVKGEKEHTENKQALLAVAKLKLCTGRMIQNYLRKALKIKLENSSICRSLNNLKRLKLVKVVHRGYCPITEKVAQFYSLNLKNN